MRKKYKQIFRFLGWLFECCVSRSMNFSLGFSRLYNSLFRRSSPVAPRPSPLDVLRVPCEADLYCRKRTSISTMLDPDLFALYMTGIDRIDEDWVIQSNPPSAFKAEFHEGCDALFELLQIDPGLYASKGFLNFAPPDIGSLDEKSKATYLAKMQIIAHTACRELKTVSAPPQQ